MDNFAGGFSTQAGNTSFAEKKFAPRPIGPVTLAQLYKNSVDHPTNDFVTIGANEYRQIVVVAQVKAIEKTPTHVCLTLDDHSGYRLKAKQWLESEEDGEQITTRRGEYVRIFGRIKTFQQQPEINIFKLKPIRDINAVTVQMLSVIKTHASSLRKGGAGGGASNALNVSSTMAAGSGVGGGFLASRINNDDPATTGFSPLQKIVYQTIKAGAIDTANGCHKDTLLRQLASKAPNDVIEAVNFLIGEGHAYSTCDDDHYRTLDHT